MPRFLLLVALLVLPFPEGLVAQSVPDPIRTISLEEAIRLAELRSPDLLAAEAELESSHADRMELRGAWLPSVQFNSFYGNSSNQRFDQSTGQLVSRSYTAQLQGGWDLFQGGRRLIRRRSVDARVATAEVGLRNQRMQTALLAAEAFYQAAAAEELVRSSRARLERAEAQLRFAQDRLEFGTATRSDLLRAELELGNAEISVLDAEDQLISSRYQLGRRIGEWGEVRPAPGSLPSVAPDLPSGHVFAQRALDSAPAILSARSRLSEVESQRLLARTAYLPNLRLTGGYDWFSFDWPPETRSWSLRLTASIPVFNNFQREASVVRVNAQAQAARAQLNDLEIGIRVAVMDRSREVQSAGRRVSIAQRGVGLAEEDLRVLEERYQMGAATILELQTSQVALADAEVALVRERQALGIAMARLEAILGETLRFGEADEE